MILNQENTKSKDGTKITSYSYTPIFSVSERGSTLRSVRIAEAMTAYGGGYLESIKQTTYDSMTYALTRIEARVKGE